MLPVLAPFGWESRGQCASRIARLCVLALHGCTPTPETSRIPENMDFREKNFPPQFFAQAILLRAQTLDSGPIHDGHHESTVSFARTPPYHVFSATKSPRIKIKFLPCESRCDADSALQLELRDTHIMYIPYLTQCSTSSNFGPKPRLRFSKLGTP